VEKLASSSSWTKISDSTSSVCSVVYDVLVLSVCSGHTMWMLGMLELDHDSLALPLIHHGDRMTAIPAPPVICICICIVAFNYLPTSRRCLIGEQPRSRAFRRLHGTTNISQIFWSSWLVGLQSIGNMSLHGESVVHTGNVAQQERSGNGTGSNRTANSSCDSFPMWWWLWFRS
jgi:hypothetical protein